MTWQLALAFLLWGLLGYLLGYFATRKYTYIVVSREEFDAFTRNPPRKFR